MKTIFVSSGRDLSDHGGGPHGLHSLHGLHGLRGLRYSYLG